MKIKFATRTFVILIGMMFATMILPTTIAFNQYYSYEMINPSDILTHAVGQN